MSRQDAPRDGPASAPPGAILRQVMAASLPVFMSQLRLPTGRLLEVAKHQEEWCGLLTSSKRLALLAPRDHSKTTTGLAYLLWRMFQVGIDPLTGRVREGCHFEAVLVSATEDQAGQLMKRFTELLQANAWLFGEPALRNEWQASLTTRASQDSVTLRSGATLRVCSFAASVRGMHPDLLLFDDVLNDQNSLSHVQREKTWRRFTHTFLPMNPDRFVILGTTLHADDLFHRLAPARERTADGRLSTATIAGAFGFTLKRYPALDVEHGTALWPSRYSSEELLAMRESDPLMFSLEFQNDPRDDAASLFPRELTDRAVDAGADLGQVAFYRPANGEWVFLGLDPAVSGAIGSDATAVMVAVWDYATQHRRVLFARTYHGLDYDAQVTLIRELCVAYGVHFGRVEDNGFQSWLLDGLARYPETREIVKGHTTGRQKASSDRGVLSLRLPLLGGLWIMPSRGPLDREFCRLWQAEDRKSVV